MRTAILSSRGDNADHILLSRPKGPGLYSPRLGPLGAQTSIVTLQGNHAESLGVASFPRPLDLIRLGVLGVCHSPWGGVNLANVLCGQRPWQPAERSRHSVQRPATRHHRPNSTCLKVSRISWKAARLSFSVEFGKLGSCRYWLQPRMRPAQDSVRGPQEA